LLVCGCALPVVHGSLVLTLEHGGAGSYLRALGSLGLVMLSLLLLYGSLGYFGARLGHLARLRAAHADELADGIAGHGRDDRSSLVALIPSYLEDTEVVRRALLSAALQPHPRRRVVLLIDDLAADSARASSAAGVRALPDQVQALLRPPRERCELRRGAFETRVAGEKVSLSSEARQVARLCLDVAAWFEEQAQCHRGDAATSFFSDLTFRRPAERWLWQSRRWESVANGSEPGASIEEVRSIYLSLLDVFSVEITSFERKRFVNLSHAPNKAMNINTYLALLGGSYRYEHTDNGVMLTRCPLPGADLVVPDADFALILDADTIVSPDYTGKLLPRFTSSEGGRLAIVQSPYSTFPGDRGVLQRIAGAQTDVQYVIHQGLTHYNATFWVGANALVRVAALREIAVTRVERGFEIVKFICDRTLIEDTESTIELVRRGWRLANHLQRLAFSMTPPDFGSLLIQRERWANGGLLIVPKLFAYLRQVRPIGARLKEGFMRLHYLISLGPVSMALLIAIGISWDERLQTAGMLGIACLYYGMYARDMHLLGYRWHDVVRVVALNILLIPVNLAGMMSSIVHGITGQKPRFRRTPKVRGRTAVPARYVLAEVVLLGLWLAHALVGLVAGRVVVTAFMFAHAAFATYAIGLFIGFRNSAVDIATALDARGCDGAIRP
jgi:cellulose synthase/poly-beta-1,6-N-acetylglucosamine synthase-like glycosyltransferase